MSKYTGESKRCIAWDLFPNNRGTPKKIIALMELWGRFTNQKAKKGRRMVYSIRDESLDVCDGICYDLREANLHPEPSFEYEETGIRE